MMGKMRWVLVMVVLWLATGLVAACGVSDDATPSPTHYSESATHSTAVAPISQAIQSPRSGAASPPLEARIYYSDVVVRATLSSVENSSIRFKVIEYLKGSGPAVITVNANTALMDVDHSKREAVLFLSGGVSGASAESTGEFVFVDAHYSGSGYSIDSLDPAWLPTEAETVDEASNASSVVFITDSGAAMGRSKETISLADLKDKIAWVDGGKDIAGYDCCIRTVLNRLRFYRDYEVYHGKPWTVKEHEMALVSGAGAGALVDENDPYDLGGYSRTWITGQNAVFFNATIFDENEIADDGYKERITTSRPLPKGIYRFREHVIPYLFEACKFAPEDGTGKLDWVVTVTAPAGTLHEAFFDPVESGEDEVSPAAFSVGGTDTEITGLDWADGKVALSLDPVVSLDGYTLDFIELDGTASLNLRASDAVERSRSGDGSGALKWSVTDEPWEDGDKLMLRIREDGAAAPPTPGPGGQGG